jgi:hypothetical protein
MFAPEMAERDAFPSEGKNSLNSAGQMAETADVAGM